MGNSCSRSGTSETYEISSISGFVVVRFMDGSSIKELQLTRECDRYVRKVHNMWWLTPVERKQIVSLVLQRAEHREKGCKPRASATSVESVAPGVLGSSQYEAEHYRKATFHIRDDDPYFGDAQARNRHRRHAQRPLAQHFAMALQNSSEYGGSLEDLTSNAPTPTNSATVNHPNFIDPSGQHVEDCGKAHFSTEMDVKVAWEISESFATIMSSVSRRHKSRGKGVRFLLAPVTPF